MEALRDLVGRARAGGIKGFGDDGSDLHRDQPRRPRRGVCASASSIRRRSPFWALGGSSSGHGWSMARSPRGPLLTASLAADHRASDGHAGGLFLSAIDHYLQEPDTL